MPTNGSKAAGCAERDRCNRDHIDPTGHIAFLAVGAAFAAYEG